MSNTILVVTQDKSNSEEKNEDVQKNSFEEKEEKIRSVISTKATIVFLLLPIVLYLFVCTLNEISVFNVEGITGGLFRVITGVMAYTAVELLIVVTILNSFFKIVIIRLNLKNGSEDKELDFLEEYLSLTGWQRIKVDLFILFSLLFLVLTNTVVLLLRIPLV